MVIRDQTSLNVTALNADFNSALTTKQIMAGQAKDEMRRKAEVELKETDSRFTSPNLIRAIEYSFGAIDFDPCWHEASAVTPKAYLDVRQGHNGLRDEWSGGIVFVNPPWSAQDKWLRRAHDQWSKGNAQTVICLVPAKTDTKFFHQTLIKEADLYFMEGRQRFSKEDGTSEATKVATMLAMFGATPPQKMRLAELVRGAWWQPSQSPSLRVEEAEVGTLEVARIFGPLSCVAPSSRSPAEWIVFCNPSNVRGLTARPT